MHPNKFKWYGPLQNVFQKIWSLMPLHQYPG